MNKDDLLLLGMFVLGFIFACFFNEPLATRIGKWVQSRHKKVNEE